MNKMFAITMTVIVTVGLVTMFKHFSHAQDMPKTMPKSMQGDIQKNWQSALGAARADSKLVGMGGAIMQNGKIIVFAVDGVQIKGKPSPITENDFWHIGSITKSMTATMIARLVERGSMDWDMKIGDVFTNMDMDAGWQNITLEQLLTHTSGARANFPLKVLFNWPKTQSALDQARMDAVAAILATPPKHPANKFVYSNVGYTIAGTMAAHISGQSWESLMRNEVFVPLGLDSAGFGPPMPTSDMSQPWGHRKVLGIRKTPVNPAKNADNSPIMGPAGTVYMDLSDMLRYANAHLQSDLALAGKKETPYLAPETWKRLHTEKTNEYAYGWVVPSWREWADGRAIWHNGSNTMWYALVAIMPEKNAVFAMATNDGDVKNADRAFRKLLSEFGPVLE